MSRPCCNMRPSAWPLIMAALAMSCAGCPLLGGVEHTTTYYAPMLSPDGQSVAYLKRVARWRAPEITLWGTGRIEYWEDRLELCRARRTLRQERCLETWLLPLRKGAGFAKGDIRAELAWEGDTIRYRIQFVRFGKLGFGTLEPPRGEGPIYLETNVPQGQPFAPSPLPEDWIVNLSTGDPEQRAYLINNHIVVGAVQDVSP